MPQPLQDLVALRNRAPLQIGRKLEARVVRTRQPRIERRLVLLSAAPQIVREKNDCRIDGVHADDILCVGNGVVMPHADDRTKFFVLLAPSAWLLVGGNGKQLLGVYMVDVVAVLRIDVGRFVAARILRAHPEVLNRLPGET